MKMLSLTFCALRFLSEKIEKSISTRIFDWKFAINKMLVTYKHTVVTNWRKHKQYAQVNVSGILGRVLYFTLSDCLL